MHISKIFTGLLLFSNLGCAIHHSSASDAHPAPSKPAEPEKKQNHPTDCAVDELHFTSMTTLISNAPISASIERVFQNVVHRDCSGSVIKQGIETVKSPTQTVPYQLPTGGYQVGAIRLFNDTSCDWSTAKLTDRMSRFSLTDRLRGTKEGKLEITLDASKGATSFHVKPGLNTIFYTYYKECVPDSDRHTAVYESCPETLELASGSFNIDVRYAESTMPGDKSVVDCNPPSSVEGSTR